MPMDFSTFIPFCFYSVALTYDFPLKNIFVYRFLIQNLTHIHTHRTHTHIHSYTHTLTHTNSLRVWRRKKTEKRISFVFKRIILIVFKNHFEDAWHLSFLQKQSP